MEGALEIYRSVVSVVQGRRARRGDRASRHSLMRDAIAALRFLSATVQEEQGLYRDVEARWKEIEKEMEKEAKFLQRGWKEEDGPMPQAVYPFPDEFTAVEARALYIQNATGRGVPLGVILQELYDSPQLTFGPTERQFFERIAFYGARKYSSDLTVQSDLRVEGVSTRRVRVEVVRQALHAIEVQLREHEYLTDDALIETGDRLIRDALVNGDLRREEMSILLGLQEPLIRPRQGEVAPAGSVSRAMVARIRARQEVRLLTAVLAAEGEIPRDVIESYRDLPHTRYHALSSLPEMRLRNQIARNGESLFDLENSTRARWMRFRLQEASHQDVNVLEIPNGNLSEAEANPMRVQMKRRPFRKKMPEVESRVEEKRTQGTGRRR